MNRTSANVHAPVLVPRSRIDIGEIILARGKGGRKRGLGCGIDGPVDLHGGGGKVVVRSACLLQGIGGKPDRIARIEGKAKLSQNRSEADRAGVVAGLRDDGGEDALRMAEQIEGAAKS